jgi:phage shock protein PspC (stress-responsive transcriptional regulator)
MKKTVTINISGIIFHIDEDAYEILQVYLSRLNNRYSKTDGGKEIISDIESRIAELFREKIETGKEVITVDDVKEVTEILGNPDDFEAEGPQAGERQAKESDMGYVEKRLYRDPDSRVFGGVCSGLGHYLNIDPVILRIIFVILFFVYGSSFLIYLILWIAIPKARTTAQKLEMKGEKINISNIERSFHEEFQEVKENFKKFRTSKQCERGMDFFHKLFKTTGLVIVSMAKIFIAVLGVGLIAFGILVLLAVLGPVVFGHTFFPFHSTPLIFFLANSSNSASILIGISLIIGIPVLALIYAGMKMIFRFKSNDRVIGITAIVFFVMGILMFGVSGFVEMQNYRSSGKSYKTKPLNMNAKSTIYLMVSNDTLSKCIESDVHYLHFREMILIAEDNKYRIFQHPQFDIEKSQTDNIELEIVSEAKGKNRRNSLDNASNISYNWTQKDSLLMFDQYFTLKENKTWRDQKLQITLKLPAGRIVYIGKEMADIIYDIDNVTNINDEEMPGKKWIMTTDGLALYEPSTHSK